LFALGLVNTIPAVAQDDLAAELYGYGVHAYHAKQPKEAFELLNSSIEQSKKDPRAFFFRGLVQHSLGRPDEATADFKTGAELEVMGSDRNYNVSFALERVQGSVRLEIEKFRRTARLELRSKKLAVDKIKYRQFQKDERDALLDNSRKPATPNLPDVATDDPNDPFAGKGDAADEGTVTTPAVETTEPVDPFGEGDKPTVDKPTVDKPAEPADPADPFALPGTVKEPVKDPFAIPTNNAPPAAGGGGATGGALSGIFRAFGKLMPTPPALGPGAMQFEDISPDLGNPPKIDNPFGGGDPFAPDKAPAAPKGGSDTKDASDPFGDLK
jgi:hypothetical protein